MSSARSRYDLHAETTIFSRSVSTVPFRSSECYAGADLRPDANRVGGRLGGKEERRCLLGPSSFPLGPAVAAIHLSERYV